MKNFFDLRKKKLAIDEENARSSAKEVEVKQKELEPALISKEVDIVVADTSKMTPPKKKAWFESTFKTEIMCDHLLCVCFSRTIGPRNEI